MHVQKSDLLVVALLLSILNLFSSLPFPLELERHQLHYVVLWLQVRQAKLRMICTSLKFEKQGLQLSADIEFCTINERQRREKRLHSCEE